MTGVEPIRERPFLADGGPWQLAANRSATGKRSSWPRAIHPKATLTLLEADSQVERRHPELALSAEPKSRRNVEWVGESGGGASEAVAVVSPPLAVRRLAARVPRSRGPRL